MPNGLRGVEKQLRRRGGAVEKDEGHGPIEGRNQAPAGPIEDPRGVALFGRQTEGMNGDARERAGGDDAQVGPLKGRSVEDRREVGDLRAVVVGHELCGVVRAEARGQVGDGIGRARGQIPRDHALASPRSEQQVIAGGDIVRVAARHVGRAEGVRGPASVLGDHDGRQALEAVAGRAPPLLVGPAADRDVAIRAA